MLPQQQDSSNRVVVYIAEAPDFLTHIILTLTFEENFSFFFLFFFFLLPLLLRMYAHEWLEEEAQHKREGEGGV